MLKTNKMRLAALLLGASAAVLSAPSFAYRGDCMADGPMGARQADGRFAERMKMQQQRVHDALKLTPQQESAWTKYQESHPFAGKADRPNRPDPAEMAKLTAPERADKMLEMQKQRQDDMSKHVVAMKDFYAQLTPEQKKTFDEQTQMGKRGKNGGRGPGSGPRGPGNMPPAN